MGLSPGINYSSKLFKKGNTNKKEEYALLISALNFACTEAWRGVQQENNILKTSRLLYFFKNTQDIPFQHI